MKKKNLLIAVVISVFGGVSYFSTMSVYAASCPSVFGSYICSDTNVCTNPGGTCQCNGVSINDGIVCSTSIDPTADGVVGTVANGLVCNDADGCTCWTSTISKGTTCSIISSDLTPPSLGGGIATVNGTTATISFTSSEDNVQISCLGSCGGCSLTAMNGSNTVNFTLSAGTYSDCSLVGVDAAGNVWSTLGISSFTIAGSTNTGSTNNGGGSVSYGWGWGSASPCSSYNLVCTNGKYVLKFGNYCVGGDLGKACGTISTTTSSELTTIISGIKGLTESGFNELLTTIKTTKSQTKIYTIQDLNIKIYVPKYSMSPITKAVLSLNTSLSKAISSKLTKITSASYLVENYELLGTDIKTITYKEIWVLVKLYNDMLATLYIVLDMKKIDHLPLAKYFLKTYLTEFINFKK